MASRRDQLNAYTFAKRRMLAAFVRSSPDGSEEGAPKPLRGVLPGIIVGVIVMAVFGAWGMFRPTAPKGWDAPNEKVIIASKSTTRYVVLKTEGKVQLHPVLNMASAKLLLDPSKGDVVTVAESELDSGKITRGVTIGIPYAPDRLPDADEAGRPKRWAVCERLDEGGSVQKTAFVMTKDDWGWTEGSKQLRGGELLYVVDTDGKQYVVDLGGTAYPVNEVEKGADLELLQRTVVGSESKPQPVTREWLQTLHQGSPLTFPQIPGNPGDPAGVEGSLDETADRVGMVLASRDGVKRRQYYVVLQGHVAKISDFMARLLLTGKGLESLQQDGNAEEVSSAAFTPEGTFGSEYTWPAYEPEAVNGRPGAPGARGTICNVLRKVDKDGGATHLSTWAGTDFPTDVGIGTTSAYVTPGSGQLYRQFMGKETAAGPVFLVTDTGLRYVLQSNADSATDDSGIGITPKQREQDQQQGRQAQMRLGYDGVDPAPIPAEWSAFLPTGPRLSTAAARQPQGS